MKSLINMFGIKMSEVQSYVDKSIERVYLKVFKAVDNSYSKKKDLQSLQGQFDSLNNKYKKLVAHLGLEYKEEMTKGYTKIKKAKKK